MKSRTFIVYLEPSGDSAMAKHVNTARNLLGASIGYDESHLYPLHCSLTSFFDVVMHDNEDEEVLNKAIRDALASYISTCFETAPTEYEKARRWTASFCSTRSCSARSRSSSLSAVADGLNINSSDDQTSNYWSPHTTGGGGSSHSQITAAASSVEDPTPLPEASPIIANPTTAAYFRVRRQLSTAQPQTSDHAALKHVHITQDGSLIYPLSAEGLSKESIALLCHNIQESITEAIPHAHIQGNRKPTPGIQPKQATHMTLLSNKGNTVHHDATWSVDRMAQFLDRAASVTMPNVTEWDVVVNEVQRWGSLDGPKDKFDRRFEAVCPHVFVEVCRLRGIGISALQ